MRSIAYLFALCCALLMASSRARGELRLTCGDWFVDHPVEQCDDGNQVDGDGCDSACQLEPGPWCWINCPAKGSSDEDIEAVVCGLRPECCTECWSLDCVELALLFGGETCGCGDTYFNHGEECDDGNTVDGDGCSSTCTVEMPRHSCCEPRCPDAGCTDAGCEATVCSVYPSCCTHCWAIGCAQAALQMCGGTCSICANGYREPGEECDDGNTGNGDGCTSTCGLETPCGNDEIDPGEQCDDGNTVSGDGCTNHCQLECGNGRIDPEEQCDPGPFQPCDHCDDDCQFVANPCNDGDACTFDTCHPVAGCSHDPLCPGLWSDNLLVNSSFEEGPAVPDGFITLQAGNTDIPGWVVTGTSIDIVTTLWQQGVGERSIDLDGSPGPGGVAQTFFTEPGQWYFVTLLMAGNPGGPGIKKLRISAAGRSAEIMFDGTFYTSADMGWSGRSWYFQAVDAVSTLEISSLTPGAGSAGPVLDSVEAYAAGEFACEYPLCSDGQCLILETTCEDGNPCTNDSCGGSGCVFTPAIDFTLNVYGEFSQCINGPGAGTGEFCTCADLDGDHDVDLQDFAAFQVNFAGP
jgi:choice-of-anchor C domain-containing protein